MIHFFRRTPRRSILVLLILILLGGATYWSSSIVTSYRVYRQRTAWGTHALSNYRYQITRSCFCPVDFVDPVMVDVRNGQTTAITYVDRMKPRMRSAQEAFADVATIDKLFDQIQAAALTGAASINVMYDPHVGHPMFIDIDYSQYVMDDEVMYSIDHFEILQ